LFLEITKQEGIWYSKRACICINTRGSYC